MSEVLNYTLFPYTGKVQPTYGERDKNGQLLHPYLPDDNLVEAVNLAISLKRPILIEGEPGSGKTRLARAVAYELDLPYFTWHIKSTSRALDGCYVYDSIGRLRDAQLAGARHLTREELREISLRNANPSNYIHWGPLGNAFQSDKRAVVLIDEIDKADIDFPNDLLLELDELCFEVKETGQTIRAQEGIEPIVFITSNYEKSLPDAFLRRCLFHYIEFPKKSERLVEIITTRFRDVSEELANKAVKRFLELRERMEEDKNEAGKKVTTSELIDWLQVLSLYPDDEALRRVDGKIPASLLLKSWEDHIHYISLLHPGTQP